MLNNIVSDIGRNLKTLTLLTPLLAFLGGILTSVSPCSLSSIPLVIGYMTGTRENNTKRAFKISIVFAIGMAITYTILGVAAALLSRIFNQSGKMWFLFLGVLMILMALQTWDVVNIIPSRVVANKNGKKGYIGALIVGIMAGLFSSPCSTPILVVLLAIVATKGSLIWGIILFLLYSLGNSVLVVLIGTSAGFVGNIMMNPTYGKISKFIKIFLGTVILLIGLYFLYIAF